MTPRFHLIGAGRAGTALARRLVGRGWRIGDVVARSAGSRAAALTRIGAGTPADDPAAALHAGELTLIAVPEAALAPLAARLAARGGTHDGAVALHVSGALPGEVLAPLRTLGVAIGSCHPNAAFADGAGEAAELAGVTFDVDGDPPARARALELVAALGGRALELAPEGKALFHAAACTASNALVALFELSEELGVAAGASRDAARAALVALAGSTLANVARLGPLAALTGPIERGEAGVVARHLAVIERAAPQLRDAYRELARATLATARRSGRLAPEAATSLDALLRR